MGSAIDRLEHELSRFGLGGWTVKPANAPDVARVSDGRRSIDVHAVYAAEDLADLEDAAGGIDGDVAWKLLDANKAG